MAQMKKPKQKTKERSVVKTKSNSFISSYSNNTEVRSSFFDVQLIFGEVIGSDENSLQVEDKAVITMSPQHAKTFLGIFATNIKRYEERYGPIKMLQEKL